MKSICMKIVLATLVIAGLAVTTQAETILLDFGNDTSWRGASVPNPDPNGNYWNSLVPGWYYTDLVDADNNGSGINFGFSTPVATDSYNGPAGDTAAHPATIPNTDIDAVALGNLGVIEAAYDYAAGDGGAVRFEIQALDPTKLYNLTFYGSHKFNSDDTTLYSVYTDNTYATLVDSASLQVHQPGSPWLHNRDTVATISNLAPQTSDILYVEFVGSLGGNGYLNSMQIEVVPEPATFGLLGIAGAGLFAMRRLRR